MTNNAPTAPADPIPVAVTTLGEAWQFGFPTFTDNDNGDTLTYTATLADGNRALPAWLTFTAATRTFNIASGVASLAGVYTIKVTATDDATPPESAFSTFSLIVAGSKTIFLEDPNTTADKTVMLDSDGNANDISDRAANGTLIITDSDGVASVEASGRFGEVVITEDSANSGHYDWVYTLNTSMDADLARLLNQSIRDVITFTATDGNGNTATHDLLIDARGTGGDADNDASRLDDVTVRDGGRAAATLIHGVQFKVVDFQGTGRNGNLNWIDVITRDDMGNPFQANAIIKKNVAPGYYFQFTPDAIITPEILRTTWDNAHRETPGDDRAKNRRDTISSEIIDANLEGVPVQHVLGRYWFSGGGNSGDAYASEDKAVALDYDNTNNHDTAAAGRLTIVPRLGDTIASVVASDARYGDFALTAPVNGDHYLWAYTLNPRDADTNALAAGRAHELITISITNSDGQITTHDLVLNITITGTAPAATLAPQSVAVGAAWTPAAITAFADSGGEATYAATLANGDDLPTWLTFTPGTRTFAIAEDATDADDAGRYEVKVTATRSGNAVESPTFYLTLGDIAAVFEEIPAADADSIIEVHGVRFTLEMPGVDGTRAGFLNIREGRHADRVHLIDNRYYEIRPQKDNYTPGELETLWEEGNDGSGSNAVQMKEAEDRIARITADVIEANLGRVAKEEIFGTYYFAPDLGDRSVAFNADDGMHDTAASGRLRISDVNGGVASYRAEARYGTVIITEDSTTPGIYNWVYTLSTDSRRLQALEEQTLQDTITFVVTDADGYTATHDLEITLDITKTSPPAQAATMFEEIEGGGGKFVIIHGVKFAETRPGSAEGRNSIELRFDSPNVFAGADKYVIRISKNPLRSQDLADFWDESTVSDHLTATVIEHLSVSNFRSPEYQAILTTYQFETPPPSDTTLKLDYDDSTLNDFMANAAIAITDPNGIMASNVTASAGTYGTFTITQDSTTASNYNWVYTLNEHDPQTAALGPGTHTETITITVVDNQGATATHALTIDFDVVGTADWLAESASADTRFNEPETAADPSATPPTPATPDKAVTLDYSGTNDVAASGTLTITDTDGVASVEHNGDAAQYGVFAFDEATGAWTYTLGPNDPETAALGPGTVQETITFTVTDGAGSTPATHNLIIDVNVMGTASWLGSPNTHFRETPQTSEVTLDYTDKSNDSLKASGHLTITDTDGVASVTPTLAQYGDFSFDKATGAWEYTLNPNDPQTLALTAGTHPETITFIVTDVLGNTTSPGHPLEITINVVGTNAAPTATPQEKITVDEDATLIFTAAHFGFADNDSGDVLSSITITGLPTAGVLMLVDPRTGTSTALTAGNLATLGVIEAANIGDLVYAPGDSFAANGTATFTYAVNDGRVNSADATMTLNIEADDDIATGIAFGSPVATLSADADTTGGIKVADITFTDPDGGEPGALELAGSNTALFEVVDDGAGGQDLRLKDGATLTTGLVAVTVRLAGDNSVSANYTLTINNVPTATPVNPQPISEDAADPLTLTDTNFGFADADGGDNLVSITIVSLPDAGTLTLVDPSDGTSTAVNAGDVIMAADIANLRYAPGDTFAANGTADITYTVSDGKTSSDEATLTITVEAEDDLATGIALGAPVATLAADEDTTSGIKLADINFMGDPDGASPGTLQLLGGPASMALFEVTGDAASGFDLRIKMGVTLTEGTFSVTIRLMENNDVSVGYTLTIEPPNIAPTTTPATGLTITKDATHTFTEGNFGFADADGDALQSITIVDLPNAGTLTLDGVAVALGDVIAVARITAGDLVYTPLSGLTADAEVTFTYTVSDGEDSSPEAMMRIAVKAVNEPPTLVVTDEDIIFDSGVFILTREQLDATDNDTPPRGLTYTLTAFDFSGDANATFEVYDTTTETWNPLTAGTSGSDTFTQQQVDNGHVRLNAASGSGTLSVTLSDVANMTAAATITATIRVVEEVAGTEVGGAGDNEPLNFFKDDATPAEKATPRSLTTGIGDTKIKLGSGDDKVDAGLGDDEIDLGAGGDDTVIYRFATDGNNIIPWSGGDAITGFTPGEDELVLSDIDGDEGSDGAAAFLNGLGTGFFATVSTAYTGDGSQSRADLDNYSITGVEIHFAQAVLLPGGVLGGSILSITFNKPIAWAGNDGFDAIYLNGAAGTDDAAPFNTDDLLFNNNAAGRDALTEILGLRGPEADDEVEALRSVAIGDGEANTIDLTDAEQRGEWVVFGGGGNDTITLRADTPNTGGTPPASGTPPAGAREVVYRLAVGDSAITAAPDGSDTISGFALGEDMLTFVVTSGTSPTPTPATNDAPEISAIDTLMAAFASVSLVFDDKGNGDASDDTYTGITFGVVAANSGATPQVEAVNLSITFAEELTADALANALGSTITDANLGTIFMSGTVPTAATTADTPATLSTAGEMLIDTLFGMTGDENNISIGASLPAELL